MKELMAVNQLSSSADFASVEKIVNQWIVESDIAPLTQKSYRTAAKDCRQSLCKLVVR